MQWVNIIISQVEILHFGYVIISGGCYSLYKVGNASAKVTQNILEIFREKL